MVAESSAPPTQQQQQQQQQQLVVEQETAVFVPSSAELRQLLTEIRWNATTTTTGTTTTTTSSATTNNNTLLSKQQLPTEMVTRIVQYLLLPRIQMEDVTAIACSSQHIAATSAVTTTNDSIIKNHRLTLLAHCLTDDETTWWISEEGLNVRPQFVEFHCLPQNDRIHQHFHSHRVVRVRSVSIKIPPLPYGPMSLQQFVMQRRPLLNHHHHHGNSPNNDNNNDDNDIIPWEAVSPVWTLDGHILEYQTFDFPNAGVDVTHLRILCLSNQASSSEVDRFNFPQMVGFYSIRFD